MLKQWIDEINNYFEDVFILVKGGGLIQTGESITNFQRKTVEDITLSITYSSLQEIFHLKKKENFAFVADEAQFRNGERKIFEMSCGANLD